MVSLGADIPVTLTLGYNPVDYVDSFVIVNNNDADAVSLGAFRLSYLGNPLDEGELFTAVGQDFTISYLGGTGNDIVLSAVPEPTAATLAGLLVGTIGLRRRRK